MLATNVHNGHTGTVAPDAQSRILVCNAGARAAYAKQAIRDKLIDYKEFICRHGDDMQEVTDWKWGGHAKAARGTRSTEADNV